MRELGRTQRRFALGRPRLARQRRGRSRSRRPAGLWTGAPLPGRCMHPPRYPRPESIAMESGSPPAVERGGRTIQAKYKDALTAAEGA